MNNQKNNSPTPSEAPTVILTPSPFKNIIEGDECLPSFMFKKLLWPKIPKTPPLSDLSVSFGGRKISHLSFPLEDLIDLPDEDEDHKVRRWLFRSSGDDNQSSETPNQFNQCLVNFFIK